MQQLEKKDFFHLLATYNTGFTVKVAFPVQNYAEFNKCTSTTSREIDTYECR